jgi:hypothetical protein
MCAAMLIIHATHRGMACRLLYSTCTERGPSERLKRVILLVMTPLIGGPRVQHAMCDLLRCMYTARWWFQAVISRSSTRVNLQSLFRGDICSTDERLPFLQEHACAGSGCNRQSLL